MSMLIFRLVAGFSLFTLLTQVAIASSNFCLPNPDSEFLKAQTLKAQGQYLLASYQYSMLETFSCKNSDKSRALISYAQSLYLLNENLTARTSLDRLKSFEIAPSELKKVRFLKAWYEPSFRNNLTAQEKLSFENFDKAKIDFENNNQLKKPWLAGSMSAILPGLGQVYNGNYQSAAISFVLNSLFLATALELSNKGLNTSAVAAGLIFSFTYTGNILSSIESSKQINLQHQKEGLDQLRKEKIPDLEL
ncbi:MAG: hypothetical protein ACOYOK_00890 [Pseudobdellovibrionaceae bacterium]